MVLISCFSKVCLRSSPLYNSGALAFTVGNETPQVGEMVNSLWNFADPKMRFRVISSTKDGDEQKDTSSPYKPGESPAVGTSKLLACLASNLTKCDAA